jgi:enoyl-CoA hydratase/carnithine racemase
VTETSRGLGASRYLGLMQFSGGAAFGTEMALTGRFFTAEEALEARLINRVTPKGTYLDVARTLADEVNQNPPLSVRATVRTRRWYLEQLTREINMQTQPFRRGGSRRSCRASTNRVITRRRTAPRTPITDTPADMAAAVSSSLGMGQVVPSSFPRSSFSRSQALEAK